MTPKTMPVSQKVSQPSVLSVLLIFAISFGIQTILVSYFPQVIPNRRDQGIKIVNETEIAEPYDCNSHKYSTEIISIDPLVIYIRNFTYKEEIDGLLEAGCVSLLPYVFFSSQNLCMTPRLEIH
jgi:hypothetical protein